ncbi:hypothetical protein [Pseudomonas sp. CF150]|uniref:hypothetical protein n=1 Tax=Pseudomonas sp. CF150 TaxID=911240 RepID=UPI000357B914|nr:hypothetical protein [Pseudomonas sp. CF150]EPL09079.1 hypothetical protein CF150_19390 [Pseudomonas sp. CF150]
MSPEKLTRKQLEYLKDLLLSLDAAGAMGFEGFVRVVLTTLTNIPFRLATSGLQGGLDGDSAFQNDAVCFEAKRYSGRVSRETVVTKIADLSRVSEAADRLWVLAATSEIGTQLAKALQEDGDKNAISTLILDWACPLPLLAVATVATANAAEDFLMMHCNPKPNCQELAQIFEVISNHPEFHSLLERLKSSLNVSTLATARSTELNKSWRIVSFGSEHIARDRLGQALVVAHLDSPSLREALRQQIKDYLQNDQVIVLTGGEGHGKSWLAAQICCDYEGLALFSSAEQFDEVAVKDLDNFIVELLISQTGDVADETVKLRWRHRLAAWKRQSPALPLLVVVDGINQRRSQRWDRTLNGLKERLLAIGGRLLVTVRPQFWDRVVSHGISFKPNLVEIPEWSLEERDQLLTNYGISLDWLDDATRQILLNPRLLGVAIATLPHTSSVAWKGLTKDRVLFEHLRASQRESFEPETWDELTNRLSDHAKKVLERIRDSRNEPPHNFEDDSTAVIETRFFRTLIGPGNNYELREEGLTLALGYTLVDQLWQAQRAGHDLTQRMTCLIDPIYAMDRTVDVVFATLMICAYDSVRFNQSIFAVLLDAFSTLQNVDDQRFEEYAEIVKKQPIALFESLGVFTLESRRRLNHDWFVHASFSIAASNEGWPIAKNAVRSWLRYYNKDALDQVSRYPSQSDEERAERLQKRTVEIQEIISSLSLFEKNLMQKMTAVTGQLDDIYGLALQLLSGRPLAEFAENFIFFGLGLSMDTDVSNARRAFYHLTTFNRLDRAATMKAFLKAIEPLRSTETSKGGQWTVVRMLFATGDETAAREAAEISNLLREDILHLATPALGKWRHSRVADPKAFQPDDLDSGLESFSAIDPDTIFQSMTSSMKDHQFEEFLPVACRFTPEQAIEKARTILSGLLTRTSIPLRQLILNGSKLGPLMTREIALRLLARLSGREDDVVATLVSREQNVQRMFLLMYLAPELTASEQLECMRSPAFGVDFLLNIIPMLKPQPTDAIISALQLALDDGDEMQAYAVLAATRYGGTPITDELESLLLRCYHSIPLRGRAFALELASQGDLKTIRDAHVHSGWSGRNLDTQTTKEGWYGAILLADACKKNELTVHELLNRTHPETWFYCSARVGAEMLVPLASHFLQRLQLAIEEIRSISAPAVQLTLTPSDSAPYPMLSIDEPERQNSRFALPDTFAELLGSQEDFYAKQDLLRSISDDFFAKLKGANALLFTERVTIEDLRLLNLAEPTLLPTMLGILEEASDAEFSWLKNLAFSVANLVSSDMPERAIALFERALLTQFFVTLELVDGLTLEHQAIWSSTPSLAFNFFWEERLLTAGSDEVLAQEVTAAERFGAAKFIEAFVQDKACSSSTLDQSFAITVAGFSKHSKEWLAVIECHLDNKGITGDAAKKAKIAHQTGEWAKRWIRDMSLAATPDEFWRCLIISTACMDQRVSDSCIKQSKWATFSALFKQVRKTAIRERSNNRNKTFVGQSVPDSIFIKGYD